MLIVFNVIFITFIGGIIIFIREYRIKKKKHQEALRSIELEHKKDLIETQMEIQIQTMKHIGREIHDNVGQKLTLSSLYIQELTLENNHPKLTDTLNSINDIINEALYDLRLLSKSLTDDAIETKSIAELIENECNKIRNLKKYKIRCNSDPNFPNLSYNTKSVLLRIVQEFAQNSIKHASCSYIDINIQNNKGHIELHLADDGIGFDVKQLNSEGIGLSNMKKRIKILNGTYELGSKKNTGTSLVIKIPVK